jgi:hypothetical protein
LSQKTNILYYYDPGIADENLCFPISGLGYDEKGRI